MSEKLLSVAEAGEVLGLSRRTILRRIDAGRLPSIKIGTGYVLKEADVLALRKRRPGRPRKNPLP